MQTGTTAEKDTAGWLLYRIEDNGDAVEIAIPPGKVAVTRVPGL